MASRHVRERLKKIKKEEKIKESKEKVMTGTSLHNVGHEWNPEQPQKLHQSHIYIIFTCRLHTSPYL